MKREVVSWAIGATVATQLTLAVGWWAGCTFYIGPMLFQEHVRSDGKLFSKEPEACRDVDSRAMGSIAALMATLVALRQNP